MMESKPSWLKVRIGAQENYDELEKMMRMKTLHTVCEEAKCPNIYECWSNRTATFMILGDICTRACRFCAVQTGKPTELDLDEPTRVAEAAEQMNLRHVVVTSVARDDLTDGGAYIFAETIRAIRRKLPLCTIEVLIPDFLGNWRTLELVLKAEPDVLNHNIETIKRLSNKIRSKAKYDRSLELLRISKEIAPQIPTKSSIMLGIGEAWHEILETMEDLKKVNCDIFTIGQYLQPTKQHVEVVKYYHPDEFKRLKSEGERIGFRHIESGPLVRSSYHAHQQVDSIRVGS